MRTSCHDRLACVLGFITAALIPTLLAGCSQQPADSRPNFVFILTDDHRWDAASFTGDTRLTTPHLDRLAREGVVFTNAFVTTSLCSPSRASFLTGCYAHNHGVFYNEVRDPDPALPSFAELLQGVGYETAFIGKWHMLRRATPRRGFDHWVAFTGQGEYQRNTLNVDGEWVLSERYITDELTDRAIAFLDRERDRPFLLYLSHKAAHGPFTAAQRHADSYTRVAFRGQSQRGDRLELKPDWGGRQQRPAMGELIREYQRTLLAVDDNLGRLLADLERRNLLDNTVIIYAGDNGYMFGEHGGLLDKRAAYEPSLRIPLLMRFPPLALPDSRCDEMVLNIDLAPTLLELAGIPVPDSMDGESWLGCLRGEPGREAFLYEYFHHESPVPTMTAIRTPQWKYITYPLEPEYPAELYDLRYDPEELHNRHGERGYADIAEQLRQQLEQLEQRTGFRLPPEQEAELIWQ